MKKQPIYQDIAVTISDFLVLILDMGRVSAPRWSTQQSLLLLNHTF